MTIPVYTPLRQPSGRTPEPTLISKLWLEFHNIQRTNPGLFVPPWTGGQTSSASSKMAQTLSITDFYKGTDGSDWSPAMDRAYAAAKANGIGEIFVPSGLYTLSRTHTFPTAVTLVGEGNPAGGINGADSASSTFLHDFDGDCFVWNGGDGNTPGSGGGAQNLRIVQSYGTPGTAYGSGLKISGVDINHRASWVRFADCAIQQDDAHGAWTWPVELDGHNSLGSYGIYGVPDLFLSGLAIVALPGALGGIRINGAANVTIADCAVNAGVEGTIVVGDQDQSGVISLVGGYVTNALVIDRCAIMEVVGGSFGQVTTTANTGPAISITGVRNAAAFTDNSATGVGYVCLNESTSYTEIGRPIQLQGSSVFFSGSGVPGAGIGSNGDYYFRSGTPATALQRIYVKAAGAWTGLI